MDKFKQPIQVTKSFLPPLEEYIELLKSIWETSWLTNNGKLHNELQNNLLDYLGVKNTTLFTNGHLALDTAIKALKLNGEVITTPFTFASTTHAIVMNGLRPVFCDINMNDFTIDTDKIEELITEKTCAILPVHVFGYPCNIKKIEEIAKKYNLKVIYDAAHVFGVEVDGVGIGNFGDISMFSLHATKVYNTIEGGLLTYNDNEYSRKLNLLKNFGISGYEQVEEVGLNAKMNEFQAAMGLLNLKYVDDQIEKRKNIANIYRNDLKDIDGVYFLEDMENVKHNYAYFPVIIDEKIVGLTRDQIHERLKEFNVVTRKYFYPLAIDFDCYKGKYNEDNLFNAKYISERVLTLPIYGELSVEEAIKIVRLIKMVINL
ncbi:DegT/DnrJ/EryC1/StrS family aminotransferase [Clostridium intestinale]|uniref:dTDP-4-amino-4,6-dideoxygalactose transaminase n=1 Tax=Clostridium intestinale DSM 6191 TaxID=1121320 RepID=A0A1M6DKN6_9CLOT|nr:DegT/DnrJ/EryC1/StrS family aminotransferase [Clostridium intestinale]SHI73762.1 dTDP-4-amino-4,6-dideoxygalactose transaminase [Clostridium intestinale DSM 6191]